MQVNENIGCYFTETDETIEDVQSFLRLPSLHDLKHARADDDDDDTRGDTGATT